MSQFLLTIGVRRLGIYFYETATYSFNSTLSSIVLVPLHPSSQVALTRVLKNVDCLSSLDSPFGRQLMDSFANGSICFICSTSFDALIRLGFNDYVWSHRSSNAALFLLPDIAYNIRISFNLLIVLLKILLKAIYASLMTRILLAW